MSSTYTPSATATWNESVTLPDDADDRGASAVNTPIEALADNQAKLRQLAGEGWFHVSLVGANANGGSWAFNPPGSIYGWEHAATNTDTLDVAIPTPENGKMAEVEIVVDGDGGSGIASHAGLPSAMPKWELYRIDYEDTGNEVTLIATAIDTSGSVAAYQLAHTIAKADVDEALSATRSYVLRITGESSTNALADEFLVTGVRWKWEAA